MQPRGSADFRPSTAGSHTGTVHTSSPPLAGTAVQVREATGDRFRFDIRAITGMAASAMTRGLTGRRRDLIAPAFRGGPRVTAPGPGFRRKGWDAKAAPGARRSAATGDVQGAAIPLAAKADRVRRRGGPRVR